MARRAADQHEIIVVGGGPAAEVQGWCLAVACGRR